MNADLLFSPSQPQNGQATGRTARFGTAMPAPQDGEATGQAAAPNAFALLLGLEGGENIAQPDADAKPAGETAITLPLPTQQGRMIIAASMSTSLDITLAAANAATTPGVDGLPAEPGAAATEQTVGNPHAATPAAPATVKATAPVPADTAALVVKPQPETAITDPASDKPAPARDAADANTGGAVESSAPAVALPAAPEADSLTLMSAPQDTPPAETVDSAVNAPDTNTLDDQAAAQATASAPAAVTDAATPATPQPAMPSTQASAPQAEPQTKIVQPSQQSPSPDDGQRQNQGQESNKSDPRAMAAAQQDNGVQNRDNTTKQPLADIPAGVNANTVARDKARSTAAAPTTDATPATLQGPAANGKAAAQSAPLPPAADNATTASNPPGLGIAVVRAAQPQAQQAFSQLLARTLGGTPAAEQVAAEIRHHVSAGDNRFTIRLDPPELGRIDIRLTMGDDKAVHAVLTADNDGALELLQRDARTLERALQDAGLKTDAGSLNFSLRQGQDGQSQREAARHPGYHDEQTSMTGDGNNDLDTGPQTTRWRGTVSDRPLDLTI